jgi:ABC-2 type transport system ATP-binding protein
MILRDDIARKMLPDSPEPIIQIDHLSHRYGQRAALVDLSLKVNRGEIFGFLGPNGSGKTTLFRILCTLIAAPPGTVKILGFDLANQREEVRRQIGVVFQSPSLDKQLTAEENLRQQGHLYGLRGAELSKRIDRLLGRVDLLDRRHERVERFSGGMRRRVELAKGMLNQPRILLLDEPSTGLDPAARIDLWKLLTEIQRDEGVTVLLTTHLMDEGDRCSRLAILDRGRLAACDTPAAMKDRIGGDVISLTTREPQRVAKIINDKFQLATETLDGAVRLERQRGHEFVPQLIESLPGLIDSVSVGKPTLEDVFIRVTGRYFRDDVPPVDVP